MGDINFEDFFKKNFEVYECFACILVLYHKHVGVQGGQKRASDSLGLEL